jgi:hypothetical protein
VDVEFRQWELFAFACEAYSKVLLQGDRKSRITFAEKMRDEATSFPTMQLQEITSLVEAASSARNGWRVIVDATVIKRSRKRVSIAPR